LVVQKYEIKTAKSSVLRKNLKILFYLYLGHSESLLQK
jgi:hypothetical protein